MPELNHDHIAAHKHTKHHRHLIMESMICGCFSCYAQFTPADVHEWCDEYETTAKCPKCKETSVLGDASGHPVHQSFLEKMRAHWHPHKA